MQHRKKHSGNGTATHSTSDVDDDGGSAKQKPSHHFFAQRLHSAFGPTSASTSSTYPVSKKASPPAYTLPGVPVVLKLVLLSFVGFAVLVVLTAKGRHAHWRYHHMRGHIPEFPGWHKGSGHNIRESRSKNEAVRTNVDENSDKSASSNDATQRMLDQPSRFVDSEKKLKQQLLKLLEKQNAEHKKKPNDPNDSTLGVKISNRYLGEDLLPYPKSKGEEKEWEKEMEKRKTELAKADQQDWNEMMQQYVKVMEKHIEENEHVDHALSSNGGDSEHNAQQNADNADAGGEFADKNKAVRPPKGTEKWPSPSEKAGADTTILLKPAFGSHRPSSNAILVFAEGYDISIYLAFVESLANTGYDGDVVLSISNEEKLKPGVKEYLQSKNAESGGLNVVAYEVNWSCFKRSGEAASGSGEGIHHCKMDNAFGDASGKPISDPREPRPVATARYELYWMWSLQYNKESWLC